MLVGVCADKGSPGVTTAGLVLAAVWPRPVVFVELDPAGGDVAIISQRQDGTPVAESPSLLGLAAASRTRADDPALVQEYTQSLRGGIAAVPGLTVAEQTAGMSALWPTLTRACRVSAVDVIADLGRINTSSPVMAVATQADVLIVVVTPTLPGVLHLRERMSRLLETFADTSGGPPLLVPLVVTAERAASGDVREVDQVMQATRGGIRPACYLAEDPGSVARLLAGDPLSGRLGRSPLVRSARVAAHQIVEMTSRLEAVTL